MKRPRCGPTEAYCRECRREYNAANKAKIKGQVARSNSKRYEANDATIRKAKKVPCKDCGEKYPYYVMDFDHVRGEKRQNLSAMRTCHPDAVADEIAKCDVVCANCHRKRTHKRMLRRLKTRAL